MKIFKRKKADLVMIKKLTLKEALTGYRFMITHLDGSQKLIEATQGDIIKPGDIRTVRELGMPLMRTPYKFGNLFVTFEVEFPLPQSLNPQQINTIRNLLPGDAMEIDESGAEKHITMEFNKSHVTENNTKIHSDYKEEEEEDNDPRFAGAKRVNCSGSIF